MGKVKQCMHRLKDGFVKKHLAVCLTIMVALPTTGWAHFRVANQDEYFGNAQNTEFHDAIAGDLEIGAPEQAFMASVVPLKPYNRFYVRGLVGILGAASITTVKNVTVPNDPAPLAPISANASGKAPQSMIALGYRYVDFAFEIEHVNAGKIRYKSNPMVQTSLYRVESDLSASVVMLNSRYFFNETQTFIPWAKIQPYMIFGAGFGRTSADSRTYVITTGAVSQTLKKSRAGMALGLGGGLRVRLSNHFVWDTALRLHSFANPKIGPISGTLLKSKRYFAGTWAMGLEFVF